VKNGTDINMKVKKKSQTLHFPSKNLTGSENVKAICPGPGNFHFTHRQGNKQFNFKSVFFPCLGFSWDLT